MHCEDVLRKLAAPVDGQDTAALAEHLDTCPACAEWSTRMASWDRLWNLTRPVEPSPAAWNAVWNRLEQALEAEPARARDTASSAIPTPAPHAPLRIAPISVTDEGLRFHMPVEVQRGQAMRQTSWLVASDSGWLMTPVSVRVVGRMAGAALVLIVLGLWVYYPPGYQRSRAPVQVALHGGPIESSIPPPAIGSVDIEEGALVVIRTADPRESATTSAIEIVQSEPDDGIDSWYVMFGAVESMVNSPVVAGR